MRKIKFRAWSGDTKEMCPWEECFFPEWFEDENMILMQYTGLLDKQGKEIYEGDILHNNFYGYIEVIWKKDGYYSCENEEHLEPLWRAASSTNIVGNIYENPKLWKIKTN